MALDVTTSIGMAMYPIDGKEYGQLTKCADQAMYEEKSRREPPSAVSANGALAAPRN